MHHFKISEHLQNILAKLSKKDKSLHEQVLKKISEVVASANVEHYKNLRYDLKEPKRAHIGHFVLVFSYDKPKNFVSFEDFDHHDNIYR